MIRAIAAAGAIWSVLATAVFAASAEDDTQMRDFEAVVLLGEHGLIQRCDASFETQAEGRIPRTFHRRGVSAANLSWDNESLLATVSDEGWLLEYSLQEMAVTRDKVAELPNDRGLQAFGHAVELILPLAQRQIFVRDAGYKGLPQLGGRHPAIHIDLETGKGEVLDTFGFKSLSEIRIAPCGDRFVQFSSGGAVMVAGTTGDIIRKVRLPEFRYFLKQEPEPGKIFPLGYDFDWEQELFDFWWISMAPEEVGELQHVTVPLETGHMHRQDSMGAWPELPDFDRFEFADSLLWDLYAAYVCRFLQVTVQTPLLTLQEARVFARLYSHPSLLAELPSEKPFRTFLPPEGCLLVVAYPLEADDGSLHSRIVALNTETGRIEEDFVFEDILNGVFFPDAR